MSDPIKKSAEDFEKLEADVARDRRHTLNPTTKAFAWVVAVILGIGMAVAPIALAQPVTPTNGASNPISGSSLCISGKALDCFNDNGAGTGFLSTGAISSGTTISIRNASSALSMGTAGTEMFRVDGILGVATSNAVTGNNAFGVTVNGARIDFGAGTNDYASSDGTTVTFAGPIAATQVTATTAITASNAVVNITSGGNFKLNSAMSIDSNAPTISSGFGTSPSIVASNGTLGFQVNVGGGGAATSGVIGLPSTASHGWICNCQDITTESTTVTYTKQTASTTTTCTVGNFTDIAGAAAWAASDKLNCVAVAY